MSTCMSPYEGLPNVGLLLRGLERFCDMARKIFYVVVNGQNWGVRSDGALISTHVTQALAMEAARQHAMGWWKAGRPSQVMVQGRDAKWRTEWTYGDDPVRYPG